MVWQGPPGTGQQDLAQTRSECQHQAEAWRTYNVQVYQQTSLQTDVTPDLYRTADRLFDRCMIAQGYKLVPQGQ